MFRVFYKYSACIKIVTDDVTILCDPWIYGTAYYGTWSQFPECPQNSDFIGDFDYLYISHIHPDHYHPDSIRYLFAHFGPKPIIVADWAGLAPNYLLSKLRSDGFGDQAISVSSLTFPNTQITILPYSTGSKSDIDSYLFVTQLSTRYTLLNINDCSFSSLLAQQINSFIAKFQLTIRLLCLGYTGAGPYPQTYYSVAHEHDTLDRLASNKKAQFLQGYKDVINSIPSLYRLPFAGQYILTGELSFLNRFRGVSDALDVTLIDPQSIVLADGGNAYFDIQSLFASSQRHDKYVIPDHYSACDIYYWNKALNFMPSDAHLLRLLRNAICNAHAKSECTSDCIWRIYNCIDLTHQITTFDAHTFASSSPPLIEFNCNKDSNPLEISSSPIVTCSMFIDNKALFCALVGLTHWNNYEVGSVFNVRRYPDFFVPEMHAYLNFLSVIA